MWSNRFMPIGLPPETESLRLAVRQFLCDTLGPDYPQTSRMMSWMGFDAEFTRALGRQGWIGMTWPKAYGGQARSALDRYVLAEELMAAGAPVLAHWTADRQSGPLILRYGTEAQKQRFLPPITRGESYFCIGMSEPDSGSDLAATRTRAQSVERGWRINGTKLWTTNAHRCQWMIALVRTTPGSERHEGLSQIIIDLKAPGVTVRPIRDLAGDAHFNEVVFDDVFVPANQLIGTAGDGWAQVMAELSFERSGPERYLSGAALLTVMIDWAREMGDARAIETIGRLMAEVVTLRQMSLTIAARLERGDDPQVEASCVKDLGTLFEQALPELAHSLFDIEPRVNSGPDSAQVLAYLTQVTPSFSLRGGTREILRGIIARGLGAR